MNPAMEIARLYSETRKHLGNTWIIAADDMGGDDRRSPGYLAFDDAIPFPKPIHRMGSDYETASARIRQLGEKLKS